jgi:DNA invertase Pin-like site-specific DNA recombinase
VTPLEKAGRDLAKTRHALAESMRHAEQLAIAADGDGVPETEIARTLGVNRMTVRRWLGKL